jgi:hypothetical protein
MKRDVGSAGGGKCYLRSLTTCSLLKCSESFQLKKDYPLEFPVVTTPVTQEEYLETVQEHFDKKPVKNPTIQTVAKAR